MTSVPKLKEIATEHGLEFKAKDGKDKMLKLLSDNNIEGFEGKSSPNETGGINITSTSGHKAEIEVEKTAYRALVETFLSDTTNRSREQKIHYRKMFIQKTKPFKARFRELEAFTELKKVLSFEKKRGMLPKKDEYELNALEATDCSTYCRCLTAPKSPGLFVKINEVYPYNKNFDEGRDQDVYTVFVPRTIGPEEQIGAKLERKIAMGFHPEEKDYPEEKILIRRVVLKESEWKKYFQNEDEGSETIF